MPRLPDDLVTALDGTLDDAARLAPADAAVKRAEILIEVERQVRRRVESSAPADDRLYEPMSIAMVGTAAQYHYQRAQQVQTGNAKDLDPSQYSDERGLFKSSGQLDEAYRSTSK
jgi:hypothetical protein